MSNAMVDWMESINKLLLDHEERLKKLEGNKHE